MNAISWRRSILLFFLLVSSTLTFRSLLCVMMFKDHFNTKEDITEGKINIMSMLLDTFRVDVGRYPRTQEGLNALYERPATIQGDLWKGPYLLRKEMNLDAWWQELKYLSPGIHNRDDFDLFSLGRDGLAGTADDVNNWDPHRSWRGQVHPVWLWSDLTKGWYWWELWENYQCTVSYFFFLIVTMVLVEIIRDQRKKSKSPSA